MDKISATFRAPGSQLCMINIDMLQSYSRRQKLRLFCVAWNIGLFYRNIAHALNSFKFVLTRRWFLGWRYNDVILYNKKIF